jgi:hypothetical protein
MNGTALASFITSGIYTIIAYYNGTVTLNTWEPTSADAVADAADAADAAALGGLHTLKCLEWVSNSSAWSPKTVSILNGKLYLSEVNVRSSPAVGRIRVATMPTTTVGAVGAGARSVLGGGENARTSKLLEFSDFIPSTSTLPEEVAFAPSSCLDNKGASEGRNMP